MYFFRSVRRKIILNVKRSQENKQRIQNIKTIDDQQITESMKFSAPVETIEFQSVQPEKPGTYEEHVGKREATSMAIRCFSTYTHSDKRT